MSSAAGVCTSTAEGEVFGPVKTAPAVLASTPFTVVVIVTRPAAAPVNVQVKVPDCPPFSDTGSAGKGPAAIVAPPGPMTGNGTASTPVAEASPVLVTVSVIWKGCPTLTCGRKTATAALKAAGVWTTVVT